MADNGVAAGQAALVTDPALLAGMVVPGQALSGQAQLRSGEWPDTPPYPDALKLA